MVTKATFTYADDKGAVTVSDAYRSVSGDRGAGKKQFTLETRYMQALISFDWQLIFWFQGNGVKIKL